jgi:ankyrin repeat protein
VRTARGDSLLMLAVNAGSADVVERLLTRRVSVDAQNTFGDTALIVASRNGDAALVRKLLDAGASTRLRNKDRKSAADIATARSFPEITRLLGGA